MWIKFANLCRKSDRMALAEKTINSLLSPERVSKISMTMITVDNSYQQRMHDHHHTKAPPNVVYAQLKYMWATGAKEESLNFLRQFSISLSRDLQVESSEHSTHHTGVSKQKLTELSKLLARCYFKLGEWQVELEDNWGSVSTSISVSSRHLIPVIEKCRRHTSIVLPRYTLRSNLV